MTWLIFPVGLAITIGLIIWSGYGHPVRHKVIDEFKRGTVYHLITNKGGYFYAHGDWFDLLNGKRVGYSKTARLNGIDRLSRNGIDVINRFFWI